MEAFVNSVDDALVLRVQYQLLESAGYITDRRDVSCFASGSDVYTPVGGTRVLRVNVNGENWLVPHTWRVMLTLNRNSGDGEVRVICRHWSFFQRMRVMCACQVIEYINGYNSVHERIKLESSDEKAQRYD